VIFVGIDWSEEFHEVELQAGSGRVLKRLKLRADLAGLTRLQEVITEEAEEPSQVVVAIEASHGLLVNALVASGYRVYDINPLTAARARQGESPAGSKSDAGDAHLLANLVRTKRQDLRPLAGDSEQAQAVHIRARSHVRAIRQQQRLRNQLRSALAKFFPGALPLLGDEPEELRDALAVLTLAANPVQARRLSLNKLRASLARHGRQRNLDAKAAQIQAQLRQPQPELSSAKVLSAHSDEVSYLVRSLVQVRSEVALLEEQLAQDFEEHPDAKIILSLPGLGVVLGARVLGESGDDPTCYANAKPARTMPATPPSPDAQANGRHAIGASPATGGWPTPPSSWARSALSASPGARRYYDQLRARNKTDNVALRALANRLVGILHGCLRTRYLYDESVAWPGVLEHAP
jgi:transposase